MKKTKATALTLVLVVMIIVGMGTTALLQAMISYSNMNITSINNNKAYYLAKAGIQYGLAQLQNGNTTSPVTIETEEYKIIITKTLNSGTYDVSATVIYEGL